MKIFNIKKENLPPIWLNTAHFVNDVYTGMLNPIMPFIAAKLAISMGIATVVLSLSHICASLLQPIFGFFADNMLKRAFIFWGLLMTSVFISFAGNSQNIYSLVVFIILGSLGSSLFHPQALGFSVRFATTDAAHNMGIFIGLGSLGFSFGPIISAGIAQFAGLDKMPWLSIFGVVLALFMFKFIPKLKPLPCDDTKNDFVKAFNDILQNNKLKLLISISMLKTLVTTSSAILLPFLWKDMGRTPFYIGFALFAFTFTGGIGSLISRRFETKIGTEKILYFSMIAPLLLMIFFACTYIKYPTMALCAYIIMGLITMMATPVIMVNAQGVLPQYKSIIGGFINGFSWGVVAIFMSVIGFVAQARGIIPVLLFVALIPAILSFVVLKKLFKND